MFGAWVVSHPVTRHGSTAGARAAILPLVRRQRENAAARRRCDESIVCLVDNQSALYSALDGVALKDAIAIRALAVLVEVRAVLAEYLCS